MHEWTMTQVTEATSKINCQKTLIWKTLKISPPKVEKPTYVANDTIKLFADDTNLFIFGNNIMSVQNEAVHSITALNNWFICNKLSLNLSKHVT